MPQPGFLSSSRRRQQPATADEYPAVPAPNGKLSSSKASPSAADLSSLVSDDLTSKMRAWAHQLADGYGDRLPAAKLTVIVEALVGMNVGEPFWVAAVSGAVDETGIGAPLKTAGPGDWPPRGAPSWSDEPLTLAVHDPTADLLLHLCDSANTSATRACVGKVVVPLSSLLPLNPFGAQPALVRRLWCTVFPAAPQYAVGTVDPVLSYAVPSISGSGMEPILTPGDGQPARVLLHVSLTLEQSVLSAYLAVPPFDVAAPHPGSARHEAPSVPPERLALLADRLHRITADGLTPAALKVARLWPWSMGIVLLGLAYWGCFYLTLPLVPAWLFTVYLANAFSVSRLAAWEGAEPWERALDTRSSEDPAFARVGFATLAADEKLARLEGALRPCLGHLEALASTVERLSTAPFSGDPRAVLLMLAPTASLAIIACFVLVAADAVLTILGGVREGVFALVAVWYIYTLASYHHRELKQCLGEPTEEEAADAQLVAAARSNPFARQSPPSRGFGMNSARSDEVGGEWLDTERRDAAASCVGSTWRNVWLRLPDAPMRAHRAIAAANMQDADDDAGSNPCHAFCVSCV